MSSSSNIYPTSCKYGCNTRIYWNSSEKTYFEVFTQKKHICPNRPNNKNKSKKSVTPSTMTTTKIRPRMSNSFELLHGSTINEIQKQYEILSDIVADYNGKVHGSQRDRDVNTGLLDIIVYYEVPEGKREEVKQIFDFERKKSIDNNNNVAN